MSRLREKTADLIQEVIGNDWIVYSEEITVNHRSQHTDIFAFQVYVYHREQRGRKKSVRSWSTMSETVKEGVRVMEEDAAGWILC